MTEVGEPDVDDTRTVVPMQRPPVRQSTVVRSDVGHTFSVFVREIGTWWPTRPLSRGEDRVRDVTFEPRLGGRVYETWHDGAEHVWGHVLAWEPPARFVISWELTAAETEVELTFTALGPALTRVAVEHRGWERLTQAQLDADCATPGNGGYTGGAYNAGWQRILGLLAAAAQSSDPATGTPTGPEGTGAGSPE
jgi:uncharacterized protein YndB with AHSA1/START domain